MKHLVTLIALITLFCSCGEIADSRAIPKIMFSFYNDKGGNMAYDEINSRFKGLQTKIIPTNSDTLYFPYLNRETNVVNPIFVPLFYNTDEQYNPKLVPKEFEEFKFILTYEKKEIFSREFRLHYDYSDSPPTITKANFKNSDGKWEAYKPQKIEVKKNDESAAILIKIN